MKKLLLMSVAVLMNLATACFISWVALAHNAGNDTVAWSEGFTELVGFFGGASSFLAVIVIIFSGWLIVFMQIRLAVTDQSQKSQREHARDATIVIGTLIAIFVARNWVNVPSMIIWLLLLATGLFAVWQFCLWALLRRM